MKKIAINLLKSACILIATTTLAWADNKSVMTPNAEPTDSPALKVGNTIYISGQGTGSINEPDPTGKAIEEAFQKINVVAKQMGASLDDVVKLTVYMADLPHDYPLLNEVVPKYFKKPYPTRSTVGVANLPKDHRVEIEAILAVKDSL